LVLIGVGHVFHIGPQIQRIIREENPGAVCLELDRARYESLMRGPPGNRELPPGTPAAYRKLAKFQQEMADHFGAAEVGGEMRAAAEAAGEVGAQVVLVDADAQQLVKKIGSEMGVIERLRFFWEMLRLRLGRAKAGKIEEEVARLQEDPTQMIEELGKKFPTVKRVLLDERNDHMATGIRRAASENDRVVAVLGDGHIDGIAALLKDLEPRVHRLRDLRSEPAAQAAPLDWRVGEGGVSVSFGFTQEVPHPEAEDRDVP
jgi:pheromone shutdown protein TraB